MLFLFAALLATASVTKALSDCTKTISYACQGIWNVEIPGTEEEMNIMCRSIIQYSNCIEDYKENCGGNNGTLPDFRRLACFLRRECNQETDLYKVMADNLVCIKREIEKDKCPLDISSREQETTFYEQLLEQGINVAAKKNNDVKGCMREIYLLSCRAVKIGKECGENAKDGIIDVFQNLLYTFNICSEEIVDELPTIAKLIEVYKATEEIDETG